MDNIYNIFNNIILEDISLLKESISRGDVIKAIDSNLRYRIWYQGQNEDTAHERLVDFYAYGTSKAGNEVVRIFQPFGFTTTSNGRWKLLRLDRITRMEPTKYNIGNKSIDQYSSNIPAFNRTGDNSMVNVRYIKKVK